MWAERGLFPESLHRMRWNCPLGAEGGVSPPGWTMRAAKDTDWGTPLGAVPQLQVSLCACSSHRHP